MDLKGKKVIEANLRQAVDTLMKRVALKSLQATKLKVMIDELKPNL